MLVLSPQIFVLKDIILIDTLALMARFAISDTANRKLGGHVPIQVRFILSHATAQLSTADVSVISTV